MSEQTNQSSRPWLTIAKELSLESDAAKALELSKELNQALKNQTAIPKPLKPAEA